MRVIFLDIDGVLHAGTGEGSAERWVWLPALVELLDGHPDVTVVIHSTWRYEYTPPELREMLGALGRRVVGVTPRAPRWDSIEWWLSQNYKAVASYRILDDAPAEFPSPLPVELIVCDPARGVSACNVQEALREWLDSSTV